MLFRGSGRRGEGSVPSVAQRLGERLPLQLTERYGIALEQVG